jgi:hypothetical protein
MKKIDLRNKIIDSKLPRPGNLLDGAKYYFWKIIYPIYPAVRDALLGARIIYHKGRQNYHLGNLLKSTNIEGFLTHLESRGFGNHFIAWEDEDELIGLRKVDGFDRQYHLRIFNDGEVRGHYEFTPESHPLWHFTEHRIENRRGEFLGFCGNWVTASKEGVSYPTQDRQYSS